MLYMKEMQSGSTLALIYFCSLRLGDTIKTNCLKLQTTDPEMLMFYFFKKALGLVSPPHIMHGFLRKIFVMLYFIDWQNFIVWLSLLLEISGNRCIIIVCYKFCNVINFEIYLSFFIKPSFCMNKNSEQKLNYLKNKKSI